MYIDILKKAALAGGKVLKKYFQKKLKVELKTNIHDIVTKADYEAQEAIIDSINQSIKGSSLEGKVGFIGEEGINEKGEYLFVIDPLDGTVNFAAGIEHYCVAIALLKDQEIIAAVVYDVPRNIFYTAKKEKGAYKGSKKLKLTDVLTSNPVVLMNQSVREENRKNRLEILKTMTKEIRVFRTFGAGALDVCWLAEGKGNLYFASGMLWDVLASKLIFEEAGGVVLDWAGNELKYAFNEPKTIYYYLAGTKLNVKNLLKYFPEKFETS